VYAKFHCALLRIKKAVGIFRELIPRTTRTTTTTRVAFGDLPSGPKIKTPSTIYYCCYYYYYYYYYYCFLCLRHRLCFRVVRPPECVRARVRPGVRPVSAMSYKPVDGISPTLFDDVVQAIDEVVRF